MVTSPQPGCSSIRPLCPVCVERENHLHAVADMIMQQCPIEEILSAICTGMGEASRGRQTAVFLFDGAEWHLSGADNLDHRSALVLGALDAASLSAAVSTWENACHEQGFPFEYGWARHLWSGVGELLG